MRDQMKGFAENEYWVYGIRGSDFDHVVELVREMINARNEQFEIKAENVRKKQPDVADDILDDVAYYRYTDNQYLWQFALWRLQGLIEAVIGHQLLVGEKTLLGLKAKLGALQARGYTITVDELDEMLLWANLRNALSHAPKEEFRPAPLTEADILEYMEFVKSLYLRWDKEKERAEKA